MINYKVIVTGFAKTVLKGTFCISRNNIEATVVLLCYNVATPD